MDAVKDNEWVEFTKDQGGSKRRILMAISKFDEKVDSPNSSIPRFISMHPPKQSETSKDYYQRYITYFGREIYTTALFRYAAFRMGWRLGRDNVWSKFNITRLVVPDNYEVHDL